MINQCKNSKLATKRLKRGTVFCFFFTIIMLFIGCDNREIGWPFDYNEDFNKGVISVGPVIRPSGALDIYKSKLCIIDLNVPARMESIQAIQDSGGTTFVSWRPKSQEIYLFKNDPIKGYCEVYLVNLEQDNCSAKRIAVYEDIHVLNAEWNPSGSGIAMSIFRGAGLQNEVRGEHEYVPRILLGYSLDECKTVQVSDISFRTHQITWLSDNLFSVVSDGRVLVIDVDKSDNSLVVKDVVNTSKDYDAIRLIGCMDGRIAYRIGGDIYLDRELFYSVDNFYRGIAHENSMLVMLKDNTGFVLNCRGQITNSFFVDDMGMLLGFSPNRNTFFLINAGKNIVAYDYSNDEKPRVLFSTSDLY